MLTDIFRIDGDGLAIHFAGIVGDVFDQTLQYGMQTTRTDVLGGLVDLPRGLSDTLDAIFRELDIDAFGGHQRFILHGDGRVRLGQDALEVVGGQRFQLNANRQTTLQLRD